MSQKKEPLACQLGMGGINFKHNRVDLCYRAINGTKEEYTTFDEVMNDPALNAQRLSLLNGEFPLPQCRDCKQMEDSGAQSYRQRIKLSDKPTQWYLDNVDPETGKMNTLHRIEFRFNNTCNLACRHCSPEYSTLWSKTLKHNPELSDMNSIFRHTHHESYAQRIDMAGMKPYIERLDEGDFLELEITGGEPFFQKEVWEFLTNIQPVAEKINLIVTSNGSIPGRWKGYNIYDLLENFNMVTLQFSIDASAKFYNYFREGGDWDKVKKNVTELTGVMNNVSVNPVITISTFQAARMPEILTDINQFAPMHKFTSGEVLRPEFMNPIHLPRKLKDRYLNEWEEYIDKLDDENKSHAIRVANFPIATMKSNDGDSEMWDKFCKYTDRLDKIFGKRVFDYFPEWEEYWTTK